MVPWAEQTPFSPETIQQRLQQEGLHAYPWSNEPDDYYPVHEHAYDKVLFVLSGSITFGLPAQNLRLTLHPGDRLELPAGTPHDAVVGPAGVVCIEAHRTSSQG